MKETVGGVVVTTAAAALERLSRPPDAIAPVHCGRASTLFINTVLIAAGESQ